MSRYWNIELHSLFANTLGETHVGPNLDRHIFYAPMNQGKQIGSSAG